MIASAKQRAQAWRSWRISAAMCVIGTSLLTLGCIGGIATYHSPWPPFLLFCPLPSGLGFGLYLLGKHRMKVLDEWFSEQTRLWHEEHR